MTSLAPRDETLDSLRRAVQASPRNPVAHLRLAEMTLRLGDSSEALKHLRNAMSLKPSLVSLAANVARIALTAGDAAFAARSLRRALRDSKAGPNDANMELQARAMLGVALHQSGDYLAAVAAYDAVLKLEPGAAHMHFNRGAALKRLSRFDEAVAAYREAVRLAPNDAGFVAALGTMLSEMVRYDEAIGPLARAAELQPSEPLRWYDLAYAHKKRGDGEASLGAAERFVQLSPDAVEAQAALASAHLMLGDGASAKRACEAVFAIEPDNRNAMADACFAEVALGNSAAAREALDLERHLSATTLLAPEGWDSIEAFNAALVAHVDAHAGIRFDGISASCHRGSTSSELLVEPLGPVAQLRDAIEREVARYRAGLDASSSHRWEGQLPDSLELSAWMTRLRSQGHQFSHNHPTAHISGVYYVSLPPAVRSSAPQGWIEFGHPPAFYAVESQGDTRQVEPHPGLLLLFPSYVFHRTVPFDGDFERVTIAFDLRVPGRYE